MEGGRGGLGLGLKGKWGRDLTGGVGSLTGFSTGLNVGMWRERVRDCLQSTGITRP